MGQTALGLCTRCLTAAGLLRLAEHYSGRLLAVRWRSAAPIQQSDRTEIAGGPLGDAEPSDRFSAVATGKHRDIAVTPATVW